MKQAHVRSRCSAVAIAVRAGRAGGCSQEKRHERPRGPPPPPPTTSTWWYRCSTARRRSPRTTCSWRARASSIWRARATDRSWPSRGPAAQRRTLAHLEAPARGMTLAGGALWLTTREGRGEGPRRPAASRSAVAGDLARPRAIACDGTWVFVVDVDMSTPGLTHASARRAHSGHRRRRRWCSGGPRARSRTSSSTRRHVYWADRLEGSIVSVPKDGGAARRCWRPTAGFRARSRSGATRSTGSRSGASRSGRCRRPAACRGRSRRTSPASRTSWSTPEGVFWSGEAAVDGTFPSSRHRAKGATPSRSARRSRGSMRSPSDGTRLFWDRAGDVSAVPPLKD